MKQNRRVLPSSRPGDAIQPSLERAVKIDLHRHLLGSARPETLWEFAQKYRARWVPGFLRRRESAFQNSIIHVARPGNLSDYIRPWKVFRSLIRSPEDINRIAQEAALDALKDGVRYVEFRTSLPGLLLRDGSDAQTRIPAGEYLRAIRHGFASVDGIAARLVAAVTRHAVGSATDAEKRVFTHEFFSVLDQFRDLVVGVDLSGLETGSPAAQFRDFFDEARRLGLPATIHAGETEGPEEIWTAIRDLGARRIGHGTTAPRDPALVRELIRRNIVLEVCPTAGWLVGAVDSLNEHPIIQAPEPLPYVICTDNPTLNRSTLTAELQAAARIANVDPVAFAEEQFRIAAHAVFDRPALTSVLNDRDARLFAGASA